MTVSHRSSRALYHAIWLAPLCCTAMHAFAQETSAPQTPENPGDIIVIRTITPRIAYRPVPKEDDPVAVRATTFPANSFDPMMATLVSDVDLTNARGSSGVSPSGIAGGTAGLAAVTQVLTGSQAAGGIARGPNGVGTATSVTGGIGGMVSSTVTNALSPMTGALGALK